MSKQNDNLAILRANLFTPGYDGRWGLPLLLWGDPGIGKTAAAKAEARAAGLGDFCALLGSTLDPADIGGYPVPNPNDPRFVRALLPAFVEAIDGWENKRGVLFLDELTTVTSLTQAALLGVTLDGRVGAYTFDPRVRCIAAANPVELAANGTPLAPPTVNRFVHLDWQPCDLDQWGAILLGETQGIEPIDADAVEREVLAVWRERYDTAIATVLAFLSCRPELRQVTPRAGDDARAWPSSRTWEFSARARASAAIPRVTTDQRDQWREGTVGTAAAREFATWLKDADLPDARALLDGTVEWAPVAYRPDRTSAVLRSIVAVLTADKGAGNPSYGARFAAAAKVITVAADTHRDFAARSGIALFSLDAGQAARSFGRDLVGFRAFLQAVK